MKVVVHLLKGSSIFLKLNFFLLISVLFDFGKSISLIVSLFFTFNWFMLQGYCIYTSNVQRRKLAGTVAKIREEKLEPLSMVWRRL